MKIFATGDERRMDELKLKLGNEISTGAIIKENNSVLKSYDVIFDLNADEKNAALDQYTLLENKLVIVCAVKKSLSMLMGEAKKEVKSHVVGMNLLPTFINRGKLETSFLRREDKPSLEKFSGDVKTDFLEVEDHVGMVTPRVICMIINEACFSLQEGVASITDIDKAMKLGTNYPYGPFEWCDRIGVKDVYETLNAIWNDTHDERYEICSLLKKRYLSGELFYNASQKIK
ncbi:MAG TPA: 3-hydroxyacyl-CoA dehydrogenase family protein [Chitinophagales bacterium]|nr:3-hydroxyacyl-CoA dehydrogenase family protein [Chitinophagales bacterium]